MELVKEYTELPDNVKRKIRLANVFFSENYYNYIKRSGNEMRYLFDNTFIVPVVIFEKIKIKYAMYISEYFALTENTTIEQKKKFLEVSRDILKNVDKVAWISTSAAAFFDAYPADSKRIPFGSHVIDLENDLDNLWKKVHSKHRNSIRKAEKSEVYVKFGRHELLEDYLTLDKETWARSGKNSYGLQFFKTMFDGMRENMLMVIAYKDREPQAGACYFLNQKMCYYMYGASADHPESGAANYLHWEVIKYLKELGVKKYSFVGCRINEDENSKYHGIQRFKERFGGKLQQGYMFKMIISVWQYKLFHLLYYIKNHKELVDTIDQEIYKWKELN